MSAVIIQKKDLEKLGKKLMKDFYERIYDDYLLKEFDQIKLKRKYYDENLTKKFLSFYEDQENRIEMLYFNDHLRYKALLKMKTEDLLEKIEEKIKDETLDYNIIYNFLDQMDINLKIDSSDDFEIDEDLFCMKRAFKNMYSVYHFDNHYLED